MRRFLCLLLVLMSSVFAPQSPRAQDLLEPLGLADHDLTSLSISYGIMATGSSSHGVFWQPVYEATEADWQLAGLVDHDVQTVYAHKSGPLGWAIGAGVTPAPGDSIFTYCSYMGQDFEPNSEGMSAALTWAVVDLDGFPDPSICGETYAAAGRAIYRRLYGSGVWMPVFEATAEGNVQAIQAHEAFPGVVLAGGGDGFAGILLLKSLDFGENWADISPLGYVADMDFVGEEAETIFAATFTRLYRTLDGGTSWSTVFIAEQPNGDTLTEVIIDRERERIYLAGFSWWNQSPLFFSEDWGESWHRIDTGMTGAIVALDLDFDGTLYLAHRTQGVFRLDPGVLDIPDEPLPGRSAIALGQNYPNPFNPQTSIPFVLRESAHVVLRVYDGTGRVIRTVAERGFSAGEHTESWDGKDGKGLPVASGAYYYRLLANGAHETRGMILVR